MRFSAGARVMQKQGVQTQLLAPADIFPALERGVIDATEFSMPTMDIKQGFHQVAKFNYFPGWHQLVSVSEVLMNKKVYDALPKSYKKMIEVSGGNQVHYTYAESEASNSRHGRDAGQAQGTGQALEGQRTRRVREGLAGCDRGRIRQGPAVQADLGRLPGFPQELRDLG
jgi:TRAP-type mannitol/chloroaromatic compound transport system substrate-binding protein